MGIKILFLVPYPLKTSPSQRFRFEQYFGLLSSAGFEYTVSSFLSTSNSRIFSMPGRFGRKTAALFQGYLRRLADLFRATRYSFIFVHREASPLGPPILEWILRYVLRKKIIYDFDDALWLTDLVDEPAVQTFLKWRTKIRHICTWSHKVSCSNDYLFSYAFRFNTNVIIVPTTVDTTIHNPDIHHRKKSNDRVTIGWTGSYSTLKYLKLIENVIADIQTSQAGVHFVVIADRPPVLNLPSFHFVKWDPSSEIEDLLQIDIGIMPLPDDEWARGKSGFKCLQYMALGIPAVASDVGSNAQIIDNGVNGYLVRSDHEWKTALLSIIADKNKRKAFGEAGRAKVLKHYSVEANSASFLSLFK